jgi:hypothetical protein
VSIRRPVWVLHVLVVGLALHNLVMSQLWRAGIRGSALSVIAAWKDVLLAGALVAVFAGVRGRPFRPTVCDWLALGFAGFVVVYGIVPQSVLGGSATHSGVLYAARHDLLPVEAYLLGRGLALTVDEQSALIRTVLWTAAGVAVFGLLDVYLVPLSFWREAAGWYEQQLGLTSHGNGLSGLPENFVYNAGNNVVFRRLTSTFLSPLATGYLLVVALLAISLRRRFALLLPAVLFAALLWTHTRAGLAALVVGLVVLAILRRSYAPAGVAALVVIVGFAFVQAYPHFAPRTHFTAAELRIQEHHAQANPGASNDATSANESSTREHLQSLREGLRTVFHHAYGFGLGNAGVTAERTKVTVEAGESTYTELAAETGVIGGLFFVAWSLVLLVRLFPEPPLAAAFAAVLFLGLQTDVIGIPWLAVAVWALAGSAAYRTVARPAKPARLVTTSPILG